MSNKYIMAKKNKRNRRKLGRRERSSVTARPLVRPELLQQAFNAHQQGDLHVAGRTYQAFLELNPRHPEASHNLGLVKFNLGELSEAYAHLQTAVEAGADDPSLYLALGYVARDLAEHTAAELALHKLLDGRVEDSLRIEGTYALGTVLQEQGRLAEARESYQTVLAMAPAHAGAWNSLASVHIDEERLEDALECLDQALAVAPEHLSALSNRGYVLTHLDRPDEALLTLDRALALQHAMPEAHSNRATALRQLGRYEEALQACRVSLELKPEQPGVLFKQGLTLTELSRVTEAVTFYRKGLELDPDNLAAMVGLAGNLIALDQVAQARVLCEKVLTREPNNVDAIVNLGIVLGAEGDEAAARVRFESALAIDDRVPNTWLQYSRTKRFEAADDAEILRVEQLCAESDAEGRACAVWHYVLGKMYHDRECYDQAFEHYRSANDCMAGMLPFHSEEFDLHLEAVTRLMTAEFVSSRAAAGHRSAKPIFIFGMPRSGTTLVEQIISSHPAVTAGGELPILPQAAQRMVTRLGDGRSYVDRLAALDHEELAALGADCFRELDGIDAGVPHVTDKLPGNYMHLGMAVLLFPRATFIHCRRDPMDVCLSNYFQVFAEGHHYTYSMVGLAKVYSTYHRLMRHWKQHLPTTIFDVTYEDLIADQESVSRALIDHCGLEWDDRCLDFAANTRQVITASMWQVRQPIYHTAKARWRHYESHLTGLKAALGDILMDYEARRYNAI